MKCRKCSNRDFSLLHLLAYSVRGEIRCQKCGAKYVLSRLLSFTYLLLEGLALFFAVGISLYTRSIAAMLLVVALAIILRIFVVPLLMSEKKTTLERIRDIRNREVEEG